MRILRVPVTDPQGSAIIGRYGMQMEARLRCDACGEDVNEEQLKAFVIDGKQPPLNDNVVDADFAR